MLEPRFIAIVFDKDSEPDNWWNAAARMQRIRREINDIYIEPHLLEWDCKPRSFTRHVQEVGKVLYER